MNLGYLYGAYRSAHQRFRSPEQSTGCEADIVCHFIQQGMLLASYYERGAVHENTLLYELTLREIYYSLLQAIASRQRDLLFRQLCLDSIYQPLLKLQQHYSQFVEGDRHYLALRHQLQNLRLF